MTDNEAFYNKVNRERLQTRQVDELIGIAKGIVADGVLTNQELEFLVRWLVANREITGEPLVGALYRQIQAMLSDGAFTDEEREDLIAVLRDYASEPMWRTGQAMMSTAIPFADPEPVLGFAGWRYCFTGKFDYGERPFCEAAVRERGADAGSLTKATDVLVVGRSATSSWLHSSYGLKIIKATGMQQKGHHIAIVSEVHWQGHL